MRPTCAPSCRRLTASDAGASFPAVAEIVIGTSSWADPGFVEHWYPRGMAPRDRLAWYAERFAAVEVNSTFYAVPAEKTVRRWAEITPPGFTFDVKLHRLLSRHAAGVESLPPLLREAAETNARGRVALTPEMEAALADTVIEACRPLAHAGKLGSFLLQLTPAFAPGSHDLRELDALVERLEGHRLAIELRNRAWVTGERTERTLDWYSDRGVAFVCVDAPPGDHVPILPPLDAVTGPFSYFRCHGRNTEGYLTGKSVEERFDWDYAARELEEIAGRVTKLAEQSGEVHVMFNNNARDLAPKAARRFRELVGQDPGPAPDAGAQLELG